MLFDHPIAAFSLASFAVALSPGPSWFYVITTTLEHGRRGGLIAVAGNGTGIACHVTAAALGLSTILSWSVTAYFALKWLGACYLIYLGVRLLLSRGKNRLDSAVSAPQTGLSIFRQGLLVNLLNPKVAILMLALLPQFIDPLEGNTLLATAGIGAIHVLIASLVLSSIVLAVERGSARLDRSESAGRMVRWVSGAVLIAFGVRLAMDGR